MLFIRFIKAFVDTKIKPLNIDIALLFFRIGIGAFMLTHGIPKLLSYGERSSRFMDFMGLGPEISLALIIFAEFGMSILIILGLFTRFATIPLIIGMSVAVFVAHADDPFSGKEKALLFLLSYIMILIMGAGRFSVDKLVATRLRKRRLR